MKKIFKKLPLTVQQSDKNKIVNEKVQTKTRIKIKKYNTGDGIKFLFHKPISKIINIE